MRRKWAVSFFGWVPKGEYYLPAWLFTCQITGPVMCFRLCGLTLNFYDKNSVIDKVKP